MTCHRPVTGKITFCSQYCSWCVENIAAHHLSWGLKGFLRSKCTCHYCDKVKMSESNDDKTLNDMAVRFDMKRQHVFSQNFHCGHLIRSCIYAHMVARKRHSCWYLPASRGSCVQATSEKTKSCLCYFKVFHTWKNVRRLQHQGGCWLRHILTDLLSAHMNAAAVSSLHGHLDYTAEEVWRHLIFLFCCFSLLESMATRRLHGILSIHESPDGHLDWKISPEPPSS